MIVLATGNWIKVINDNYKLSLFEIKDYVDGVNSWLLRNDTISFYSTIMYVLAIAIIVMAILNIILFLLDIPSARGTAMLADIFSSVLAIAIIIAVARINSGFGYKVFRTTANPYLLIIVSTLPVICTGKKFADVSSSSFNGFNNRPMNRCTNCGAPLVANSTICMNCGAKLR